MKLKPSREKMLGIFLKYMPLPPELRNQLEAEKVTNHIVLFLLPDMTTHYEGFTGELKARSHPFHEITGQLRPKVRVPVLKSVVAVIIPKIAVHGSVLNEIALKIGMKK